MSANLALFGDQHPVVSGPPSCARPSSSAQNGGGGGGGPRKEVFITSAGHRMPPRNNEVGEREFSYFFKF